MDPREPERQAILAVMAGVDAFTWGALMRRLVPTLSKTDNDLLGRLVVQEADRRVHESGGSREDYMPAIMDDCVGPLSHPGRWPGLEGA
jgi:hypothetical protein